MCLVPSENPPPPRGFPTTGRGELVGVDGGEAAQHHEGLPGAILLEGGSRSFLLLEILVEFSLALCMVVVCFLCCSCVFVLLLCVFFSVVLLLICFSVRLLLLFWGGGGGGILQRPPAPPAPPS